MPISNALPIASVLLLATISLTAQISVAPATTSATDRAYTVQAGVEVQPHSSGDLGQARLSKKKLEKYDVSKIGSRQIGSGINLYSADAEAKFGRELANDVEKHIKLVHDPTAMAYLSSVVGHLAVHSDAKVPFTVRLVDNYDVNAFSLPGGYLYIDIGLLLATENEAELAGVLSHEIAHVAARHATKNVSRRRLLGLASVPLMFVGGGVAATLAQTANIAGSLSLLKFSRNDECEADLLGIEYSYASGYDPIEFVRFLERMKRNEKSHKASLLIGLFSTHPMTSDRIARMQQDVELLLPPQNEYVVTTSDFEAVKERLASLRAVKHVHGRNVPSLHKRVSETTPDSDPPPINKLNAPQLFPSTAPALAESLR